MDNICEVCGGGDSISYEGLLVTCSKCNSTRTHVYCMRVFRVEIPEVWICESCQLANDSTLAEPGDYEESLSSSTDLGHPRKFYGSRKFATSGWKAHCNKQKPVETGKVKFLSQEEVARLSSGSAAKAGSPLRTSLASTSRKTTSPKPKAPNQRFFPDRVKTAAPCAPPRLVKPSRDGRLHKSSIRNQRASRTSKKSRERTSLTTEKRRSPKKRLLDELLYAKDVETPQIKLKTDNFTSKSSSTPSSSRPIDAEKKAPSPPAEEHVVEKQPLDALILSREVETSNKKTEKEQVKIPCAPVSSTHSPQKEHISKKQLLDVLILSREVETLNKKTGKEQAKTPCALVSSMHSPYEEHVAGKQPVDALILSGEIETSNKKTEKEPAEAPCTPLDIKAGGDTDDAAEHNHSNVPQDLPIIPPNFDLYRTYLPALHTTWKGGFSIVDSASTCEVLEGFQAQPPCKVHKKAYEFSTKMPPILQLQMLPRLRLWADLFQDGRPDLQDIALYFFPADNSMERFREKFGHLFERMEIQSSIMLGYVNDVELLIFTSKQLNVDSQNILLSKAENFFCGVFLKPGEEELPKLLSSLACSYPNDEDMDNGNAIGDMEIDMIGGKSVGRVDYVMPRDSSTCRSEGSNIVKSVGRVDYVKPSDSPTCRSNEPNIVQDIRDLLKLQATAASVSREIVDPSVQRPLVKFKLSPIKGHDKPSGLLKKMKCENVFENTSLTGSLKHSQEHSHGSRSTGHIAELPPGFQEKKRGSCLAIKAERNHYENPFKREEKT